jgi:hypothetical protein
MDSRIVIVAYKPLPGKLEALEALVASHHPRLLKEGLVTNRPPITLLAADQTIIEIFEWVSSESIQSAHSNPAVLAMWQEFSAVCEYIPAGQVKEFQSMFSEFTPLKG